MRSVGITLVSEGGLESPARQESSPAITDRPGPLPVFAGFWLYQCSQLMPVETVACANVHTTPRRRAPALGRPPGPWARSPLGAVVHTTVRHRHLLLSAP